MVCTGPYLNEVIVVQRYIVILLTLYINNQVNGAFLLLPCFFKDYDSNPELGSECYHTAHVRIDLGSRLIHCFYSLHDRYC